jgi:hypothetical protein
MKATLTYKESKTGSGEGAKIPVVTVFADGKQVAQLEGEESGSSDPPSRRLTFPAALERMLNENGYKVEK